MKLPQLDLRALSGVVHDALALVVAWFLASFLLDGDGLALGDVRDAISACIVAVPIQITVSFLFGVYQGIWRYTSLPDIQRIRPEVSATTAAVLDHMTDKNLAERYHDGRQDRLDGLSVDYDDWHFNVRPSNTEPLLRLCLESLRSREDMEAHRDELLDLIRS